MIRFPTNGTTAAGYLATPPSGAGPAVIVLQEWWGLVDHIKDVADRLAAAGFTALAPDLYDGRTTSSPGEAGRLMMALEIDRAERTLGGAVDWLQSRKDVTGARVGVIGFCMGGQLALYAACANSAIGACVDFYGIHPKVHPDFPSLRAPVLGFFAERDDVVPPSAAHALRRTLEAHGHRVDVMVCDGADHAFFNDTRHEVYHAAHARRCWERTLSFLSEHLTGS